MSVKVSARLPEDIMNIINSYEGSNFSEKLINLVSDSKKQVSDNITKASDSKKIFLDSDKAAFLVTFINLYSANFNKFRVVNEDINNNFNCFFRGILADLGYEPFPEKSYLTYSDVKDLIKF